MEELNDVGITDDVPETNTTMTTDVVTHGQLDTDCATSSHFDCPSDGNVDITVPHVPDIEDGETRHLWIGNTESASRRRVHNCCAICLCQYEVGDTVVWSCRRLCKHAFHVDCMVDWLTKMRDGTPCPCCRQEFTDIPILQRRKMTQRRTTQEVNQIRNFDPSVLSFR
jgi:Ring finger domain